MKNLSKSRYSLFRQCSKALWLRIYNPDVATEDKALELDTLAMVNVWEKQKETQN